MSFIGTTLSGPLGVAAVISGMLILGGIFLTLYRLVRGPTLPDRVVALDLTSVLLAAMLTLLAIALQFHAYLDAALVLSLIGFLATAAFARYVERRGPRPPRDIGDREERDAR